MTKDIMNIIFTISYLQPVMVHTIVNVISFSRKNEKQRELVNITNTLIFIEGENGTTIKTEDLVLFMLHKVVLTFKSVDETPVCDHSNENY